MLGWLFCMPFIFLMLVGVLMEGSRSERIGSIFPDVGSLGNSVLYCFLISPALILQTWRMK
ncbi:hypothetical protein DAI22_08g154600 [Oryza sativa Japonica Group]|nr:hypothetical protein DAI22_08g154600 [Oryza sativa Japonica Group]